MAWDPWARQADPVEDVPVLRSLGPRYEPELHGRHVAVLLKVLTDKSTMPAKNIAVAGHYGSGKSSVILGVQQGLDSEKVEWVNLSLSSLGIDNADLGRVQAGGSLAPPLTNLIQKEIVKQLLYRKSPGDMPGSRYLRIEPFKAWPAVLWAVGVSVASFLVAVLFGLVSRLEKVGPKALVASHAAVPWIVVAVMGAGLGVVSFFVLRGMQNRLRVESVSAGGTAVKLSARENSYFDEYLDEIVYFFQNTKTQVAIFEDLDRFKDPHIFETLRELNTVLNNSEQIKRRPIRFVYAVRDSIFEQLDVHTENDAEDEAVGVPLSASALETVPSANRTKFFDLVVPMVPFITHRSARDLLAAEFAESDQAPTQDLVNLVGARLTDMRLIHNIRNEFEIYRASILREDGLEGLTADRLFAMMVYKNLHLEDFEAIRLGSSKIDEAHAAFRDMVKHQADHQAVLSKKALDRVASDALWKSRARAAGERLQKVLPLVNQQPGHGGAPFLRYQGTDFQLEQLTSVDLWRPLTDSRDDVQIFRPGLAAVQFSFDDLMTLLGDGVRAPDKAAEADAASLRRASRVALETRDFVTKATMADLMARTDLTMPVDGDDDEKNLASVISELVSPLALDLLAGGYIDENFTLYCSDYHAIAISVSAMNFILHCVQANRSEHRFHFDDPTSIEAVEREMGARFLDGEAAFNLEVFDHYLPARADRLQKAIEKLVVRVGSDASFVDAYLMDGASREIFVGELARRWSGVFTHLITQAPLDDAATIKLVDAATQSAAPSVDYETSEEVAQFISDKYDQMSAMTGSVESTSAANLAVLIGRLEAQVNDLSLLGEEQRVAVVAAALYPVTRANLSAALGEGVSVALDVVKASNVDVYGHLLVHAMDYLDLLENDDVTVENADEFVAVLHDVAENAESALHAVADRASESCEIADLQELDERAWTAAAATGRLATSVANVSLYVEKLGVNDGLVTGLRKLELVDDVEEALRSELAYVLIESEELDAQLRISLVEQLNLSWGLDPGRLADAGLGLVPLLLKAGQVPDAAETYARIGDRPFSFREQYMAESKDLPNYVCDLPLSSDDLAQVMRSGLVAPAVKRAVADRPDFVRGRISRAAAIAVCEWASKGNTVSAELLVDLAQAGAPAERILLLLVPLLPDIEMPTLDVILQALGDDYEPLTRVGHHRPKLKEREGTEELLEELIRRNRVSSYRDGMFGGVRVNMRH
jgi:hypothetical protein